MSTPRTTSPLPSSDTIEAVQTSLLGWYDAERRDLPWRRTRDPYAILVSEVMLQQTQVDRVAPKWRAFLQQFPSAAALAAAPVADVIKAWSGLGYNRRAVNLHRMARAVVEEHGGEFPRTREQLQTLPGVGPYTARAVASIAFNEPAAAVDTNVRRVLTRIVDGPDSARSPVALQALADAMLAEHRPGDWNQALMDLGARICRTVPDCPACPLREHCAAAREWQSAPATATGLRERRAAYRATAPKPQAAFSGSNRFYRGRIVDLLRAWPAALAPTTEAVGAALRLDYGPDDRTWLDTLLNGLARDGLLIRDGDLVRLPD